MSKPSLGQTLEVLVILRFWRWIAAALLIAVLLQHPQALAAVLFAVVSIACIVAAILGDRKAAREEAAAGQQETPRHEATGDLSSTNDVLHDAAPIMKQYIDELARREGDTQAPAHPPLESDPGRRAKD